MPNTIKLSEGFIKMLQRDLLMPSIEQMAITPRKEMIKYLLKVGLIKKVKKPQHQ